MAIEKNKLLSMDRSLEITERPFQQMAVEQGLTERSLLTLVRALKKAGVIRRIGAVLRQEKAGLRSNALVAWRVCDDRLDAAAKALARFDEVSHCYSRRPAKGWPFNLYTMVHARDRKSCLAAIALMAACARLDEYRVLFTVRELKKEKAQLSEIMR